MRIGRVLVSDFSLEAERDEFLRSMCGSVHGWARETNQKIIRLLIHLHLVSNTVGSDRAPPKRRGYKPRVRGGEKERPQGLFNGRLIQCEASNVKFRPGMGDLWKVVGRRAAHKALEK